RFVEALATQDTVTLLRGAIRGLLRACSPELAAAVRAALVREDDYQAAGKPVGDWEDPAARGRSSAAGQRRCVSGRTRRPASGWSMRCSGTAIGRWVRCAAGSLGPRS